MKTNSIQYKCILSEFTNISEKIENNKDTYFLFIKKELYDNFLSKKR